MIYFLGCDVAKAKVDVSLIDHQGREIFTDTFPNEVTELAQRILGVWGSYLSFDDQLCCVVESTSTYHYALCEAAYGIGHQARVYNPLLTKQQIRATVRGKKTDRTDATLIARLGLRGEGLLYVPDTHSSIKQYVRSYQKLGMLSSAFKLHHSHLLERLDGEISDSSRELLLGIQVSILEARKQLLQDLVASADGDTFRILQTIPGVGPYIAASCLGEIRDIRRFSSAHALTAYAGLDPKVRQSGKSLNSTGKLTKRGSSYLRRSLFIAANVARQHDSMFKELYDKKRSEGKSYKVAICVVARKLLAVIRSVWLNGKAYDASFRINA